MVQVHDVGMETTQPSSPKITLKREVSRRSHMATDKVTCYRFYVGVKSWATIEGRCSTGTARSWAAFNRAGECIGSFESKAEAVAAMTAKFAG